MTEAEAAHAAHDILQVLAECHRQCICYADVKPANFLLTRPYRRSGQGEDSRLLELRTTDFGCSQRIQEVRIFKFAKYWTACFGCLHRACAYGLFCT